MGILDRGSFCVDDYGRAEISDLSILGEAEIEFKKICDKDKGRGRFILYHGVSEIPKEADFVYNGEWCEMHGEDLTNRGGFMLVDKTNLHSTKLAEFLLNCQQESFANRIILQRKSYSYLPLDKVHFIMEYGS